MFPLLMVPPNFPDIAAVNNVTIGVALSRREVKAGIGHTRPAQAPPERPGLLNLLPLFPAVAQGATRLTNALAASAQVCPVLSTRTSRRFCHNGTQATHRPLPLQPLAPMPVG